LAYDGSLEFLLDTVVFYIPEKGSSSTDALPKFPNVEKWLN
jgi:hypothetical protein